VEGFRSSHLPPGAWFGGGDTPVPTALDGGGTGKTFPGPWCSLSGRRAPTYVRQTYPLFFPLWARREPLGPLNLGRGLNSIAKQIWVTRVVNRPKNVEFCYQISSEQVTQLSRTTSNFREISSDLSLTNLLVKTILLSKKSSVRSSGPQLTIAKGPKLMLRPSSSNLFWRVRVQGKGREWYGRKKGNVGKEGRNCPFYTCNLLAKANTFEYYRCASQLHARF